MFFVKYIDLKNKKQNKKHCVNCVKMSPFKYHKLTASSSPVVIRVVPVVKVHQESFIHHIGDSCYTDQGGIHPVHCFQLHSDLKTTYHIDLNRTQADLRWDQECAPAGRSKASGCLIWFCRRETATLPGVAKTSLGATCAFVIFR